MVQRVAVRDDWDEWDIYAFEERERLAEVNKNATNKGRPEGNEQHEEAIQVEQKGEGGILRIDQQKETRVRKVAQVRKRRKGKKRKRSVISTIKKLLF